MPRLTNRTKIVMLVNEGISNEFEDAYWMMVDMGEMAESDTIREWAKKQDKIMTDEDLSLNAYMAKYGRGYL